MIGKVTRGSDGAGLLRYLYGPGRANEHTNPHLVASWLGDDRALLDPLEPNRTPGLGFAGLSARLSLPVRLLPDQPDRPVWQCSMRTADGDRRLTDAEWATVAREVVERTGFAPAGDPGGCRWVAVRHADDHIHVVVVLARQDGGKVDTFRDWPKVHAAARAVERRFGLQQVTSPDRTATPAPTRAEVEKAARQGLPEPARRWLARQVRQAAAGSLTQDQFAAALTGRSDLQVSWRYSQQNPGQVTGYRVGRAGDLNADGQQVWFSGSKLAPDLSLPRLQNRWSATPSQTVPRPRKGSIDQQRRQILGRAEQALDRTASSPLDAAQLVSVADTATTIARIAEPQGSGPFTRGADALARATRNSPGTRPVPLLSDDLRLVAAELSLLTPLLRSDARHVALIAAHLARIAAVIANHRRPGPHTPEQRQAARQARQNFRTVSTETGRNSPSTAATARQVTTPHRAQSSTRRRPTTRGH